MTSAKDDGIAFVCPFCGLMADAFLELAPGRAGVRHLEPPCPVFVRLEPDAFLRAVRKRWADRDRAPS